MKANVGTIDRVLRILAGVVLIALTLTGTIGLWGWIGLVPLATGSASWSVRSSRSYGSPSITDGQSSARPFLGGTVMLSAQSPLPKMSQARCTSAPFRPGSSVSQSAGTSAAGGSPTIR